MFTMLVGMATWFAMLGFLLVERTVFTIVLFIITRQKNMKAVWWAAAGFLLGIWALIPYVYYRRKISKRKCSSCGTLAAENSEFCINCGERIERIDDGATVKKFILSVIIAYAAVAVLGNVLPMIIN